MYNELSTSETHRCQRIDTFRYHFATYDDYIQDKDHSMFSEMNCSVLAKDRMALQGVKHNADLSRVLFNKYSFKCFDYPPSRIPLE